MSNPDRCDMVERVAKAIWDTCGNNWAFISERDREVTMRQARAVIEVMREPTSCMMNAGYEEIRKYKDPVASAVLRRAYRAMIDAALGKP